MYILKSLLFTILVPGTVVVLIPYNLEPAKFKILIFSFNFFHLAGLTFFTAGALITFFCIWDFIFSGKGTPAPIDPPKELVIKRLYRFSRNPMYLGVLLLLIGEALFFRSISLLIYSGCIFLFFHLFVVYYEEPTLNRKFHNSYLRYCDAVPRWFPKF